MAYNSPEDTEGYNVASSAKGSPGGHVCPWWFAYTFDNFLRRLVHDPADLLGPYVGPGMSVLDIGCGMGHFSIGMARLVGDEGRVYAVDVQQKMLEVMMARARRAGVAGRISPRRCTPESLGVRETVDFALLFWMAHEVSDPRRLFDEVRSLLRPGSAVLYAEPSFHVQERLFDEILATAVSAGLRLRERPKVRFSRAALLEG